MKAEKPKIRRARLFVALDLPDPVLASLDRWGAEELRDPALRPVAVENLHVTLAFLGSRPADQVEPIADVVRESGGPAPIVELGDPVARPSRGRPKLFALPVISPGTELLQAGLRGRLLETGLHEPDKRPFWPHLTVARVRAEGRGSRRSMRVGEPPRGLPASLVEPFYGIRIVLYRSELQPSGARSSRWPK
jgi:2'-5' RNA ligase